MTMIEKVKSALNTFEVHELQNHFPAYDPQVAGEYGDCPSIVRPTQAFWKLWRTEKDAIKASGISVFQDEGGDYFVQGVTLETEPKVVETESTPEPKSEPKPTFDLDSILDKIENDLISPSSHYFKKVDDGKYQFSRDLLSDEEVDFLEKLDDVTLLRNMQYLTLKLK